jgi:hypothetical protein
LLYEYKSTNTDAADEEEQAWVMREVEGRVG